MRPALFGLAAACLWIAAPTTASASSVAQDFDALGPDDSTIVSGDPAPAAEPGASVSTTDRLLEAHDAALLTPLDLETLADSDEPEAAPEAGTETAVEPAEETSELAKPPRPLPLPRPLPRMQRLRSFDGYIGGVDDEDRDTRSRSTSR